MGRRRWSRKWIVTGEIVTFILRVSSWNSPSSICSGRSRCSGAGQGASPLGVVDELLLTFQIIDSSSAACGSSTIFPPRLALAVYSTEKLNLGWEEGGDNVGEKGGDQAAWWKQGIGYIGRGRGRKHGEGVGWHAETTKIATSSV
jgi:hypothetical protein